MAKWQEALNFNHYAVKEWFQTLSDLHDGEKAQFCACE